MGREQDKERIDNAALIYIKYNVGKQFIKKFSRYNRIYTFSCWEKNHFILRNSEIIDDTLNITTNEKNEVDRLFLI